MATLGPWDTLGMSRDRECAKLRRNQSYLWEFGVWKNLDLSSIYRVVGEKGWQVNLCFFRQSFLWQGVGLTRSMNVRFLTLCSYNRLSS
jgi:hypothetical protein